MSKGTTTSVAREGDILDRAITTADLRVSQADRVYDVWRDQNLTAALNLLARYKAAPGTLSVELPADQVAALGGPVGVAQLVARAAQTGASLPDAVMGLLDGKAVSGAGTLASDEKPPSRKKERTSLADAVMVDARNMGGT